MNLCILTTDTPHHAYFVRSLREKFPATRVFCETGISKKPAVNLCLFEKQREEWEWKIWFQGKKTSIPALASTQSFPSLNTPEALSSFQAARPDIVVVFGTGILKEPVLRVQPERTFNLHGGDPEVHRGLDTHLWAIHERRFTGLVTTLHRIDVGIDTGEIVERVSLPIEKNMELFELRAMNTEVCLQMTLRMIRTLAANAVIHSFPQVERGRYFTSMPPEIKDQCPAIFRQYTANLGQ
jgi:folate-dependent phosphoribosylglycinamide formyltransferase PurN